MSDLSASPIPRVAGLPIIGSAWELSANPAAFVMQVGRANGGLAEVRSYRRVFVAVTDPEYVRHILVTHPQKYRRSQAFGSPYPGGSLVTIDSREWEKRRRQVASVFRFEILDRLMLLIRDETGQALERWDDLARRGAPISIADETRRLVILGLTGAMFSGMPASERLELTESVLTGLRLTRRRTEDAPRIPRVLSTPTSLRLHHVTRLIDRRLRSSIVARPAAAVSERRDLLDALLAARDPESGDPLDESQVIAELKGFLAGGIDTTAEVLAHVLAGLATHPELATGWHSEVDQVFGRRLPERAELPRLSRLTQVVNETMRLHPPTPTLSRECAEADVIDGHIIPRGTRLLLSILAVHHDERYWPQPDEFRPGRFAREWPRHAFLPFGTGHHACVANNFALMQIFTTLAMIGQRFRISAVSGSDVGGRNGRGREDVAIRLESRG